MPLLARHTRTFFFALAVVCLTLSAPNGAVGQSVSSQSPTQLRAGEPYFHEAAQYYLAEKRSQALQAIEDGLQTAPGHPKLLALRRKIEEASSAQQEPNDQGPESDQQQGDSEQDSQNGTSGESSDDPSRQDGADPQTGEQGPPQGDPGRPGDQGEPQQPGDNGDPRPGSADASETPPRDVPPGGTGRGGEEGRGTLSRAQAERILEALEGQEKQLLREVQKRDARPRRVEKDW